MDWRASGINGCAQMINMELSNQDGFRFWEKVSKTSIGCWKWNGAIDLTTGRGRFRISKKNYYPIHIMFLLEGIDVPSGMKAFNLCKDCSCVNPNHWELGTPFGRKVKNQIRKKRPLVERFWDHVDIKSQEECWEWKSSLDGKKYGQFAINQKQYRSHRISWELTCGKIPNGLCVLHKCDNSKCVNPSHLFLGTQKDNIQDMARKGRHWRHKND